MNKVSFLNLNSNYELIKDEINPRITKILTNCDYILGEDVKKFEINFSTYINTKYFIGVGNGTDALEIAIKSLDLNKDDEIIIQGNTFIATALGVLNNNLKLVLCDVDKSTCMIDIDDLKNKINKNTKALIIVYLYGLMPNMEEIIKICNQYNINLIEDCAQAHGAEFNGKKAGSFGILSCFSFYPGKNLGAYGDAGGIGTNSDLLYKKICKIRNTGSIIKYNHEIIGRNSRLDTIQAAILDVKLKYLDLNNTKRRLIANLYYEKLKNIKDLVLPSFNTQINPSWHLFVIKTEKRDDLKDYLGSFNIECLIHYPKAICEHEAFLNLNLNKNSNCIKLSQQILSLPLYPELEHDVVLFICNKIENFFIEQNKIKSFDRIIVKNKPGILNCINDINFNIERIFYIDSFTNQNLEETRGNHANIDCKELLFITNGKIKLTLTNMSNNTQIFYLYKNNYIIIDKLIWLNLKILDCNTTIMVLCDTKIKNNVKNSIYDFDEFLNYDK
jgi:dTDP-4-amino-4,6-dideoxygalactose transaminase